MASGEPRCRRGLSLLLRAGQLVQRVERRREVVGAADRTREVDQTIVHAVTGGSEHTCEHTVVAGLVGAEGNEVQPVFPHGSVRYAARSEERRVGREWGCWGWPPHGTSARSC